MASMEPGESHVAATQPHGLRTGIPVHEAPSPAEDDEPPMLDFEVIGGRRRQTPEPPQAAAHVPDGRWSLRRPRSPGGAARRGRDAAQPLYPQSDVAHFDFIVHGRTEAVPLVEYCLGASVRVSDVTGRRHAGYAFTKSYHDVSSRVDRLLTESYPVPADLPPTAESAELSAAIHAIRTCNCVAKASLEAAYTKADACEIQAPRAAEKLSYPVQPPPTIVVRTAVDYVLFGANRGIVQWLSDGFTNSADDTARSHLLKWLDFWQAKKTAETLRADYIEHLLPLTAKSMLSEGDREEFLHGAVQVLPVACNHHVQQIEEARRLAARAAQTAEELEGYLPPQAPSS